MQLQLRCTHYMVVLIVDVECCCRVPKLNKVQNGLVKEWAMDEGGKTIM